MLTRALLPAINHLLKHQAWANQRLQAHAGQVAALQAGPFQLRFEITEAGYVQAVPRHTACDVELHIPPAAAGDLLSGRFDALSRHIAIRGNAALAETLALLLQHLRPDIGGALSPVVGNAAAHRIERSLSGLAKHGVAALERTQAGLAEFLQEEAHNGPVRKPEMARFSDDLQTLSARLDALEKRTIRP